MREISINVLPEQTDGWTWVDRYERVDMDGHSPTARVVLLLGLCVATHSDACKKLINVRTERTDGLGRIWSMSEKIEKKGASISGALVRFTPSLTRRFDGAPFPLSAPLGVVGMGAYPCLPPPGWRSCSSQHESSSEQPTECNVSYHRSSRS